MPDKLTFYHFNDVVSFGLLTFAHPLSAVQYHISNTDLIERFAYVFNAPKISGAQAIPPMTIFSGDAFSPSLESSVLKGEHMVPVLNHLQIDVACYGNHGIALRPLSRYFFPGFLFYQDYYCANVVPRL